MRAITPLSQVAAQGAPSAEYDLFLSHQRGEMGTQEYYTENARLTGEKTREFVVRPYIPIAQSLRSYCDGRVYGNTAYDQQTAQQLGFWVQQVFKAKELNDHDFTHLLWAIERCAKAQLSRHVEAIEKKILEYMTVQFPFEHFDLAMKTKTKDAIDRQGRGERH